MLTSTMASNGAASNAVRDKGKYCTVPVILLGHRHFAVPLGYLYEYCTVQYPGIKTLHCCSSKDQVVCLRQRWEANDRPTSPAKEPGKFVDQSPYPGGKESS